MNLEREALDTHTTSDTTHTHTCKYIYTNVHEEVARSNRCRTRVYALGIRENTVHLLELTKHKHTHNAAE